MFRLAALLAVMCPVLLQVGCSRSVAPLVVAGRSAVALTGSSSSMIYLARTNGGVLAIDLGASGRDAPLRRALGSLGATTNDIRWVFLTHSHRDHIGTWRALRHARFHVALPERTRLFGDSAHRGWIPRTAERVLPARLPKPGELDVRTFSTDTSFTIGRDTLLAYVVPGHTAGSAVYLFRGVLFLGDAVTYSSTGGFAPAKRGFSDDTRAAAANLVHLWKRLPPGAVRYACTAHAHCARFTQEFMTDAAQ